MDSRFAIIPLAAIADRGLTLEQLRVLLALHSFKAADSDVVFPSRQAIAGLTGLHLSNISMATSMLEAKGWLKKDGKGGYSKATRYTITIPNTLAQSATVAQSATGPVAESAMGMRVAESAMGKEHTKEHTNRTKSVSANDFNPHQWLIDRGVTQAHARDWLAVRKVKKAANTETAFARVLNQSKLAGKSLDQVVMIMAEKSWQSFNAEWVVDKNSPSQTAAAPKNYGVGETRTRGGRVEVFNENMGWVPA